VTARWYREGTAAVASGQTAVTGTLTGWTNQVRPGDFITFDAGASFHEVAAVGENNTALTLALPYPGSSASGAYAVARVSPRWSLASDLAVRTADLLDQIEARVHVTASDGPPSNDGAGLGDVHFERTSDLVRFYRHDGANWPAPLVLNGAGLALGGTDGQMLVRDTDAASGTSWAKAREVLTGHRTYYVRADGNNNSDGLSVATALASPQRALQLIATLDASNFLVTIDIGPGTFGAINMQGIPLVGGSRIIIKGAGVTQTKIESTGHAMFVSAPIRIDVSNMEIEGRLSCITLVARAQCYINANTSLRLTLTSAAGRHLVASAECFLQSFGATLEISGNAQAVLSYQAFSSGLLFNTTLRSLAPVALSRGFIEGIGTNVKTNGNLPKDEAAGVFTGRRYEVSQLGLIASSGGGANLFPGSIAGTTSTGGLYV